MSEPKFFPEPPQPSERIDIEAVTHILNFLAAAELLASRILQHDGLSEALLRMGPIHLRRSRHIIEKAMAGCEKELAKFSFPKPTLSA